MAIRRPTSINTSPKKTQLRRPSMAQKQQMLAEQMGMSPKRRRPSMAARRLSEMNPRSLGGNKGGLGRRMTMRSSMMKQIGSSPKAARQEMSTETKSRMLAAGRKGVVAVQAAIRFDMEGRRMSMREDMMKQRKTPLGQQAEAMLNADGLQQTIVGPFESLVAKVQDRTESDGAGAIGLGAMGGQGLDVSESRRKMIVRTRRAMKNVCAEVDAGLRRLHKLQREEQRAQEKRRKALAAARAAMAKQRQLEEDARWRVKRKAEMAARTTPKAGAGVSPKKRASGFLKMASSAVKEGVHTVKAVEKKRSSARFALSKKAVAQEEKEAAGSDTDSEEEAEADDYLNVDEVFGRSGILKFQETPKAIVAFLKDVIRSSKLIGKGMSKHDVASFAGDLAQRLRVRYLHENEVLHEQGVPVDAMYILVSGELLLQGEQLTHFADVVAQRRTTDGRRGEGRAATMAQEGPNAEESKDLSSLEQKQREREQFNQKSIEEMIAEAEKENKLDSLLLDSAPYGAIFEEEAVLKFVNFSFDSLAASIDREKKKRDQAMARAKRAGMQRRMSQGVFSGLDAEVIRKLSEDAAKGGSRSPSPDRSSVGSPDAASKKASPGKLPAVAGDDATAATSNPTGGGGFVLRKKNAPQKKNPFALALKTIKPLEKKANEAAAPKKRGFSLTLKKEGGTKKRGSVSPKLLSNKGRSAVKNKAKKGSALAQLRRRRSTRAKFAEEDPDGPVYKPHEAGYSVANVGQKVARVLVITDKQFAEVFKFHAMLRTLRKPSRERTGSKLLGLALYLRDVLDNMFKKQRRKNENDELRAAKKAGKESPLRRQSQLTSVDGMAGMERFPVAMAIELATKLKYVELEPDELLFKEGSMGNLFYIILEGAINVYKKRGPEEAKAAQDAALKEAVKGRDLASAALAAAKVKRGDFRQKYLTRLEPGMPFGERALANNVRRSATCQAARRTRLMALDRESYLGVVRVYDISKVVQKRPKARTLQEQKRLAKYLFENMRKKGSLKSVIDYEIASALAKRVTYRELVKDEVLFRQGDVGNNFYIILMGMVVVSAATNRGVGEDDEEEEEEKDKNAWRFRETILAHLGGGIAFGEVALQEKCPRTATITGKAELTRLMQLSRAAFSEILAEASERAMKRRVAFMQLSHVFSDMSFADTVRCSYFFRTVHYPKGKVIVTRGTKSMERLFFIRRGKCNAVTTDLTDRSKLYAKQLADARRARRGGKSGSKTKSGKDGNGESSDGMAASKSRHARSAMDEVMCTKKPFKMKKKAPPGHVRCVYTIDESQCIGDIPTFLKIPQPYDVVACGPVEIWTFPPAELSNFDGLLQRLMQDAGRKLTWMGNRVHEISRAVTRHKLGQSDSSRIAELKARRAPKAIEDAAKSVVDGATLAKLAGKTRTTVAKPTSCDPVVDFISGEYIKDDAVREMEYRIGIAPDDMVTGQVETYAAAAVVRGEVVAPEVQTTPYDKGMVAMLSDLVPADVLRRVVTQSVADSALTQQRTELTPATARTKEILMHPTPSVAKTMSLGVNGRDVSVRDAAIVAQLLGEIDGTCFLGARPDALHSKKLRARHISVRQIHKMITPRGGHRRPATTRGGRFTHARDERRPQQAAIAARELRPQTAPVAKKEPFKVPEIEIPFSKSDAVRPLVLAPPRSLAPARDPMTNAVTTLACGEGGKFVYSGKRPSSGYLGTTLPPMCVGKAHHVVTPEEAEAAMTEQRLLDKPLKPYTTGPPRPLIDEATGMPYLEHRKRSKRSRTNRRRTRPSEVSSWGSSGDEDPDGNKKKHGEDLESDEDGWGNGGGGDRATQRRRRRRRRRQEGLPSSSDSEDSLDKSGGHRGGPKAKFGMDVGPIRMIDAALPDDTLEAGQTLIQDVEPTEEEKEKRRKEKEARRAARKAAREAAILRSSDDEDNNGKKRGKRKKKKKKGNNAAAEGGLAGESNDGLSKLAKQSRRRPMTMGAKINRRELLDLKVPRIDKMMNLTWQEFAGVHRHRVEVVMAKAVNDLDEAAPESEGTPEQPGGADIHDGKRANPLLQGFTTRRYMRVQKRKRRRRKRDQHGRLRPETAPSALGGGTGSASASTSASRKAQLMMSKMESSGGIRIQPDQLDKISLFVRLSGQQRMREAEDAGMAGGDER